VLALRVTKDELFIVTEVHNACSGGAQVLDGTSTGFAC